ILRSRGARRIFRRLIGAAGKGDDAAFVIDRVCAESFDARKLRRRWRLRAAQDIDRAGKLCELEFEPSRSSFKQITKLSAFGWKQLPDRTSVAFGRRCPAPPDI